MGNIHQEHEINNSIQEFKKNDGLDTENISDGYHTFGELYKHRFHLYIALCQKIVQVSNYERQNGIPVYARITRSKIHKDGLNVWEEWGMFLLCIHTPEGQISYHLDNEYWDKCKFAEIEETAEIEWDGHTAEDVLERLLKI